ncbi:unnamed protein product [Ceutorhynchus assimilis]|uniref:Uncharacterized protein n=1 Tax=Ceutorhynchus assimilis TaxID=467358 RepID=A0A9N9N3D6_9CUCU|nr:unnamed protein product [Ceutorhynchus assimilis]
MRRSSVQNNKLKNSKLPKSDTEPSTSRSYTPPPTGDKVGRLQRYLCIPIFTPGNSNLSSTKLIDKIEQLGIVNDWDDTTMVFVMQNRLGGLARRWYDNLPSY